MHILDMQDYRAGFGRSFIDAQQYLTSDHHACDFCLIGVFGDKVAWIFATPKHGDIVGEFQHLAQFMGNEDNGFALLHEAAQDAEEFKGFLRSQHARWLVHDQNVGGAIEDFEDFDALLETDGEFFNAYIGVDGQAVLFAQSQDGRSCFFGLIGRGHAPRLMAKDDIFGDRKRWDEHKVLVNHTDLEANGITWPTDMHLLAVDKDFAAIGMNQAIENIHEG